MALSGNFGGAGTTCPPTTDDCDSNGVPDTCQPDSDCDGVPDACTCTCSGDVNGDMVVNQLDLLAVGNCVQCQGAPNPACDVNCDGVVNTKDFGDEQCLQFNPPSACCPLPHGACLDTSLNHRCILVPEAFCLSISGTYLGDDSACPPIDGDCNANGIGDGCEPQECVLDSDCRETPVDDICTCDFCLCGVCYHQPRVAGDVNCDCVPTNLDDILCVLGGFSNYAACPNADLHDASAPTLCKSNGIINLDDILRVLATFAGQPPCAQAECNEPCPQGACCNGLSCHLDSPGNCFAGGDNFKGIGTLCPPIVANPCP